MNLNLTEMKNKIESWEKYHQVEVLRILNKHEKDKLNENRNGIFVNLLCISNVTKDELHAYIQYVDNQMSQLKSAEKVKDEIKDAFFGPATLDIEINTIRLSIN